MQLFEHQGKRPRVDPSAYVAPTATLVGDVRVGPGSTVLFGAVLAAEGGPVKVGRECVVMENAVLRGLSRHPLEMGDYVLVGPHAHLTGCRLESEVFVATGACIFNGALLERGSVVRIQGIVHVRSRLESNQIVPIGWIALGDPAEILPPDEEKRISEMLLERDFRGTVFGLTKDCTMRQMNRRYTTSLRRYRDLQPVASTD